MTSSSNSIKDPYVGLRPFDQEDSRIFFGRGAELDDMLVKLQDNRFLAVVGASGSGKSSLVRAGLIPALQEGMLDGEDKWSFIKMLPGDAPIVNLARAISFSAKGEKDAEHCARIEAILRRRPNQLSSALREIFSLSHEHQNRFLILIDQFEEIFRYFQKSRSAINRNEAIGFVNLLLNLIAESEHRIYVVITMRSDFLGDCNTFHGLPEAVSKSQYLTPRLTASQIKETITGPLQIFGMDWDPMLPNQIINDLGDLEDEFDYLPLLQHSLLRSYLLGRKRGAERFTIEDYRNAGGITRSLHNDAEETWEKLGREEKRIAEKMFRALSERSEDYRLTRRISSIDEISKIAVVGPERVTVVVNKFQDPQRSFICTSPAGPVTEDTALDIVHESLLRRWSRIKDWIKAESAAAATFLQLQEICRDSESIEQPWLLPEAKLEKIQEWLDTEKPTGAWAERYCDESDPIGFSEILDYVKLNWDSIGGSAIPFLGAEIEEGTNQPSKPERKESKAESFLYWCFVSYRHADNQEQDRHWASWLQSAIEQYDVPADLIGTTNVRGETIPERIYPIFRDEDSLAADSHLQARIEEALVHSAHLVVICSPRAAQSRYVAQEISIFLELGRRDRIIPVIVDGQPGDPDRECFPEPLRLPHASEGSIDVNAGPLAADFRLPDGSHGFTSSEAYQVHLSKTHSKKEATRLAYAYESKLRLMMLIIIAGILSVPLDVLRDSDKSYQLSLAQERARRLRVIVTVLLILLLIISVQSFLLFRSL